MDTFVRIQPVPGEIIISAVKHHDILVYYRIKLGDFPNFA